MRSTSLHNLERLLTTAHTLLTDERSDVALLEAYGKEREEAFACLHETPSQTPGERAVMDQLIEEILLKSSHIAAKAWSLRRVWLGEIFEEFESISPSG